MSNIVYFILAMIFNHGLKLLLVVALVVGWSDLLACETNIDDPIIVAICAGCP